MANEIFTNGMSGGGPNTPPTKPQEAPVEPATKPAPQ